ncbi:MAG: penicillin-binding protein 2 [Tychonema bourrellyi B0820]|uniref:Penicillin-binding protein 2 n=1 Tax=Tychonema bourrellyi FEM_GT703 TaxID=2040638 RepID=A0A2G4EWE3_9CYAN|nr:penicillin-binding protein 2 [Tychonema bourrellyi]MDQ2096958.1 penicillin-binding protein 2 [Tychonema bourrellyi B0820]PHX53760.1 penicillin-binding protein 2 [Tychonema bourrellyi FEM_GT703]
MASDFSFKSQVKFEKNGLDNTVRQRGRSLKVMVFMLLVTTLVTLPLFRLAELQLVQGAYNRQRAENNRIRPVSVAAVRGQILDRNQKIFATHRVSRSVYLWPKERSPQEWQEAVAILSPIVNIPATEIIQKIDKAGYKSALPVRISKDINIATFIALGEQANTLRGVEIRPESGRDYPNQQLASHLLGYVGEATLDELKANPGYPMGMIVGKMGVEKLVNPTLEGVWGSRLIEVNAKGEEIQDLGVKEPIAGKPVQLTLDLDMQKTAEKALGNRLGAVVAIDIKTGALLTMGSWPTFDPNIFTRKLTQKEWDRLQGPDKPFLNRAVQGYPVGSTFKIVTSVAGMESGKFSPDSTLLSSASINIGGISFNEHGSGYGTIGFRDALAYSSNTFFYQVGMAAGPEQMSKWASKMGIGGTINLDILGLDAANHGQVPTPAQKKKMYGEDWYVGDTVTMSIGQGLVLCTPLELAVMVSTIANGGWRVQPHLLASQTNTPITQKIQTGIKPATLKVIREGLIDVVLKGTGRGMNDGTIPLSAGKTGTVEIPGHPDNSMYVGFAPADKPEVAIAVIVEGGGFGAVSAAPIAHEVFRTYFQKQGFKPIVKKP